MNCWKQQIGKNFGNISEEKTRISMCNKINFSRYRPEKQTDDIMHEASPDCQIAAIKN